MLNQVEYGSPVVPREGGVAAQTLQCFYSDPALLKHH